MRITLPGYFQTHQVFVKITGATGFRIDAIKHIDRRFLLKFASESIIVPQILLKTSQITTTRQKVPGMFMVGECWCGQYVTPLLSSVANC